MSKFSARAISIVGGFVFAILAIECGLRVAGSFAANRRASEVHDADPTRPIIIFCGDSNIYGVYVGENETLPKAVERLTRRRGEKGVRCMNYGVPGAASWSTLDQVREAAALKPAAIVVTCGVNNYSTMPPDAGLGPFESLNITKMVRRTIFNSKVQAGRAGGTPLHLGPGESRIDGAVVPTGGGGEAVRIVDREGTVQTFAHSHKYDAGEFRNIAERLGSDFREMLKIASGANSRFVFSTYLAGELPVILDITNTMRRHAGEPGCILADCAAIYESAILAGDPPPAASIPFEKRACRQSEILTSDLHPTALGYEIEARIVNNALAAAGIVRNAVPDDPLDLVRANAMQIPQIIQLTADVVSGEARFEARNLQKDDRVRIFVGTDGTMDWKNLQLPIATGLFERHATKYTIGSLRFTVDESGRALARLPCALLRELPKPVTAMCVTERGAAGGGALRYPSALIEVDPEK